MNYLNPVSFLDTINYKIGYQLYLFIKKNNTHSHLIIHGRKYSGKTLLIQSLFRDLYQGEPILQQNENFKVFIHKNYYIFDCNAIYNKQSFIDYLKSIVKSYDYYNNQSKYIILLHFETTNEMIQNSLRVIVEKGSNTCKMIFVTSKLTKLITPLQSRCVHIRIPVPSPYDKFLYLKKVFKGNSISFNNYLLMKLCKKHQLETVINKYFYINDNIDLLEDYSNKVRQLIYDKSINVQKIYSIRKLSSNCKEVNISMIEILKKFIESFVGSQKEKEIIHEIAKYDAYLQKSYRDLIHLESLIISLNSIMNDI